MHSLTLLERGIHPLVTMVLQFVFHIIILTPCLIYPLACGNLDVQFFRNPVIAQPGCDPRCGSVEIPYPFGMNEPKCYADKWFEIECRNTSRGIHKPYLKSIHLEVTFIDVNHGMVQIKNPVFYRKCRGKDSPQPFPPIHMRGSPFVYSQHHNKFTAFGCNILAFLHSNGSEVAGCVTVCNPKKDTRSEKNPGCHGRLCCATTLPKYLSEYNVTLEDIRNKNVSDSCGYALIATHNWKLKSLWLMGSENKKGFYAPAVLEWEILNSINVEAAYAECYNSNVTSSKYGNLGRRCSCRVGFYGNPYIAGGCVGTHDPFCKCEIYINYY